MPKPSGKSPERKLQVVLAVLRGAGRRSTSPNHQQPQQCDGAHAASARS